MNLTMGRIADATVAARQDRKSRYIGGRGGYSVVADPTRPHVQVIYRGTAVAVFNSDSVTLRTGSWQTPTTKNVMNAALNHTRYHVYQQDWEWYVRNWSDEGMPMLPYQEGMTLPL